MASLILRLPHLLLLLLSSPPFLFAQTTTGVINIGSFLLAGDGASSPWRSPSEDFAFGFQKADDNGHFLLAIWFFKIPENTIVWYAKHNNDPVLASHSSKIVLTASDGLVLRDTRGEEIWSSELKLGTVAFAAMNDTGNFELVDANQNPLWESFRFPADTLLPSQVLLINDILSSRRSEHSYAQGRFQFRLLVDGNAVLNTINLPTTFAYDAYYISGTRVADDPFHSGYNVVFDEDGFLYVLKRSGERVNITRPAAEACSTKTHYYRATLNFDGVFTVSCLPKSSRTAGRGRWEDIAALPDNICMAARGTLGSGACGYNSICTLKPGLRRPSCKCPPGYSLIDPKDENGSCKPDIMQSCELDEGAENSTSLVGLPNTDWPMLDYELYSPFKVEDCRKACLDDCLCVVAVFRDDTCWKKKLPLSNGREDPSESSVSFLKLRRKTAA